jgi:hypothetical protein
MFARGLSLFALLGALFLFFTPERAHAAGLLLYNTGEDAFEVGPLPEPLSAAEFPDGVKAGYKCQVFGLFWAYIAKWDCTPVAFLAEGDTINFNDDPEVVAAIAAKYTVSDIKGGFWTMHGRWILLLALITLIVAKVLGSRADNDTPEAGQS